jgi:hypothetical protein
MEATKQAGFVAWLAVVVVPPVVATGVGQRFVAHHAMWTVVIVVAYEAAVAVGGFFAAIARDVLTRWQKRIADRVDLFLQGKTGRFERRYREFVLGGLRFMDHRGLANVGPFTPELDAVFVSVGLVPRPPRQIRPGILPDLADTRTGSRVLADFLGRERPAVLAVVGSPGSGKTTLLRYAARQSCLRKRSLSDRWSYARDIPILLYLRDHAAAILADPSVSVAALLRGTLGAVREEEPPVWFERQLRRGRCVVLLDGLDEVARQEDRAKVSAWAEGQVRQYPRNDFVVSSRPQGYLSAPIEGADIEQVCGFTAGQTEAFVRGWYQAVERHSTGTDGPEVEARASDGANDLLRRLEQAPALYDLTVNPLLLTMIANVHRWRGALPGSRADLYSEICEVMLWRRQDAKNLTQQMRGEKKEGILSILAYTMMKRRVSDLSRADVLGVIQPALRHVSHSVTSDWFLADVSSNGLLIERETHEYAFAHKTFQEYLTATHIRENGLVSDLADAVSDDWWLETTLLYAATSNADPIIRACLDSNSAPALVLALDCAEQDSYVDPDLHARVHDLVIAAARPDADKERRRLFAGILLTRHMRQRERTIGGTQVCAQPVPAEIYLLFLADTQTPEPDAPLAESGVTVGMRSSDADEFVKWAIMVTGGQQNYRLPKAGEVTELAARQQILALPSGRSPCPWIQTDKASPPKTPRVPWLPESASSPYKIDSATLVSACQSDAARPGFMLSGLLLCSRILIHAFDLAHAPDLAFARDFAGDLVGALSLNTAFDLDRVLAPARDFAGDLAYDIAHARARALGIDRAFDSRLGLVNAHVDRTLDLSLARDLGLAHDLGHPCDLARDLGSYLDSVANLTLARPSSLAFNLAAGLNATVNRHLPSGSFESLTQSLNTTCHLVLGRALSRAIMETIRNTSPYGWNLRLAEALVNAAGAGGTWHLTVDPSAMETTLSKSVKEMKGVFKELTDVSELSLWSPAVLSHLRQIAEPIFARTQRPTPEKAAAIRTAALCLAAEADGVDREKIGDMFREVAAGITLLEHRAMGARQPAEVIMLAVDTSPFGMRESL